MENTKYGRRRVGRWTPIRAKAQDTRANPNSWGTHLVRKRWDIGLLWALSLRIMMMMMMTVTPTGLTRLSCTLSMGVQNVYCMMHQCTMVKIGASKKHVNYTKSTQIELK